MTGRPIPCPFNCCSEVKIGRRQLLFHLKFEHTSTTQHLQCKLPDCGRTCSSVQAYEKHLCRWHFYDGETSVCDDESVKYDCSQENRCYSNDTGSGNINNSRTSKDTFVDNLILFCLKLRDKYVLSNQSYLCIMNDIIALFSKFHADVIGVYKQFSEKDMPSKFNYLTDESFFPDLWSKLQNESLFADCCKSLGLVEPTTFSLSNGGSYQYVSILNNLVTYLSQDDIAQSFRSNDNKESANEQTLANFTDGELFSSHSYFNGNASLLRIHLYCDEVEVCNPLGTSRAKHKLTCFYYVVGNIGNKHTSSLRNIFLALLIESKILKKYDYSTVLRPLIEDTKKLESYGLCVSNENLPETIFDSVATLAADNLGAHDIGGFRKTFSSGRICRFCMCSHTDLLTKCSESDFVLRRPDIHNMHVLAVANDSTLKAAYGVVGSCSLSCLKGFSPVQCIPPDIMHDCMEGIIPHFLQYFFSYLTASGVTSINILNEKLQSLVFGPTDYKNKPRALPNDIIQNNGKVSLSASEAWCLFRLLPLILYDLISGDNDAWRLYGLLSEIFEIVFAPRFEKHILSHLNLLISKFYSSFVAEAPSYVKPKFHFLLHYPRLMSFYGPLCHLWCMRFEQFHQKLKKIVRNCPSFKNVAFTIAHRLQQGKCYELVENSCLYNNELYVGKNVIESSEVSQEVVEFLKATFDYDSSQILHSVAGVTLQGVTYANNLVFIVDVIDNIPVFVTIHKILVCKGEVVAVCKYLKPIKFHCISRLFEVELTDQLMCLQPGYELYYVALDCYETENKKFLRLRHYVFGRE